MEVFDNQDTKLFKEFLEARNSSYESLQKKYNIKEVEDVYFINTKKAKFLIYKEDLERVLKKWKSAHV